MRTHSARSLSALVGFLALTSHAPAIIVVVGSTANVFGGGYGDAPDPGGGGGGTPPVEIDLELDAFCVQFPEVTGLVSCIGDLVNAANGPDGGPFASGTTDILPWRSLSGIRHDNATMFLTAVFTGPGTPSGTPPPSLDVTSITNDLTFSPLLNQVFFVGDGRTASNGLQSFAIPTGARKLSIGFADAFNFGDPQSLPGWYGDNAGAFTVNVVQCVPEPAGIAALALGLLCLARRRRS